MDYDQDGCRDASEDSDDDKDGVLDELDACPVGLIGPAGIGQDQDGDGCIDAAEDDDDDNDGVLDLVDACAQTPQGAQVGVQGCSMTQLDDDLDGVSNAEDMCLNSLPVAVDENGCAVIDSSNTAKTQNDSGNAVSYTHLTLPTIYSV